MEQLDHKTGFAPETDGATIVTIFAAFVIYRHKNVDHLETQSKLPNQIRQLKPLPKSQPCFRIFPPVAADANPAGQQLWSRRMQLCWHRVHTGTRAINPRQEGKFQYSYWKEQWDAEVWITAVSRHYLPWLQRGFEFGPKVLKQQMGHGRKMWSHRYSAKDSGCRERQLQLPRKNTHKWFQQVSMQWVGYYRPPQVSSLPRCSPLPLWWRFPPSGLSWFRVMVMLRVYLTTLLLYHAPPPLIARWLWEVTLSPCPHRPTWEIPIPPPPALGGFTPQTATALIRGTTLKPRSGKN